MINVIVPDTVLLGDEHGVGWVQDYGPVPGDLLREWIAHNAETGRRAVGAPALREPDDRPRWWPMDSESAQFEGRLAEFLRLRDQEVPRARELRRPGSGASTTLRRRADGGPTWALNGQGTCEAVQLREGSSRLVGKTETPDRTASTLCRPPPRPATSTPAVPSLVGRRTRTRLSTHRSNLRPTSGSTPTCSNPHARCSASLAGLGVATTASTM